MCSKYNNLDIDFDPEFYYSQFPMAPSDSKTGRITKKNIRKGSWTKEEDEKLAEYIESHGATKWKTVAMKSGLNRCEKSCRLRWLNYLRPNIKRGNFTDQEEDLIIRLHKLIGNRWSLIAGRIPGRTDNDIKNYWNSHLCKKKKEEALSDCSTTQESESQIVEEHAEKTCIGSEELDPAFNFDKFFDESERFSMPDWSCQFLELEDYLPNFP